MIRQKIGMLIQTEIERGYRLAGAVKTRRPETEQRNRLARWLDYYGTRGLILAGAFVFLAVRFRPVLALAGAVLLTVTADYLIRRRQQSRLTRLAREMARRKKAQQLLDSLINSTGPEAETHLQDLARRLNLDRISRLGEQESGRIAFLGEKEEKRTLIVLHHHRSPAATADLARAARQAQLEQAVACYFISVSGFTEPAVCLARSTALLRLINLAHFVEHPASGTEATPAAKAQEPVVPGTVTTPGATTSETDGTPGQKTPDREPPENTLEKVLQGLIKRSLSGIRAGAILAFVSLMVGGPMRYYFLAFTLVNLGFSVYYYLKARSYLQAAGEPTTLF